MTLCLLWVSTIKKLIHISDLIPETDVIMVWHAYMLNPRDFLEDCLRQGKMRFWRAGLPWAAINPCIDNDTFEYKNSYAAMERFEDRTGYKWESLNDSPTASIECPTCTRCLDVPRTKWDSQHSWTRSSSLKDAELYGELLAAGFSDKKFEVQCQCGVIIDHDILRTLKFRRDIRALRNLDVPMPGTILNDQGIYSYSSANDVLPSLTVLQVFLSYHLHSAATLHFFPTVSSMGPVSHFTPR